MALPLRNVMAAAAGGLSYIQGQRAAAQDNRADEDHKMRQQMLTEQLKALRQDQQFKDMTREHEQALQPLLMSGDPTAIQEWSNKHYPSYAVQIARTPEGGYLVKDATGAEQAFKDTNELAERSVMMAHPMSYLSEKMKDKREQAKNRKLVYDKSGRAVGVDMVSSEATPIMIDGKQMYGSDKDVRPAGSKGAEENRIDRIAKEFNVPWHVAYEINKNSSSNPAEMTRKIYMELSKSDAENFVERSTDERMKEAMEITKRLQNTYTGGIVSRYSNYGKPGQTNPAARGLSYNPVGGMGQPGIDLSGGQAPGLSLYGPDTGPLARAPVETVEEPTAEPTATAPSAPVKLKSVYAHPSGRKVTRAEIEATAKNRGMTAEQVIEKLGLQ